MVNKMILIGNVGRVPDIRETSKGGRVASFSLATSEKWTDKESGEKRERTEWHNVVVFNERLVEVVEKYVGKGTKLYIEGQHRTRDYTDKDGNKRWVSECVLQGYGGTLLVTGRLEGAGAPPPADDFDAYGTSADGPGGGGGQMSISEEIMAEQGGAA